MSESELLAGLCWAVLATGAVAGTAGLFRAYRMHSAAFAGAKALGLIGCGLTLLFFIGAR